MEIARAICQLISCELINKFHHFVVNVDKFWHLIKPHVEMWPLLISADAPFSSVIRGYIGKYNSVAKYL